MTNSSSLIYPDHHSNYSPEDLVFIASLINLKEVLQIFYYICDLQTNGELSLEDACKQIYEIWQNYSEDIQIVIEKSRFSQTNSDA
ncbi:MULTISPECIES: DUF7219 family protein [Aerosakkonema]|uniref:DUF7219 family protein n=1 Tax=Aerosakkonema TaxID=1246629 RepID=UPI0035B88495